MDRTSVDIVLPVYYGNLSILESTINTLVQKLKDIEEQYSFIIVISINGCNQEAITALAKKLADQFDCVQVLNSKETGKGWGVLNAWQTSTADIVSYMDVDMATDLCSFADLLKCVVEGGDFAIGSRYLTDSKTHRSLKRLICSKAYHILLINYVLGLPITDVQCGFKACRREAAQKLIPHIRDRVWFFEAEMLYYAHYLGFIVKEVPVVWKEAPKSGLHLIKAGSQLFKGVMRLKFSKMPNILL